MLSVLLMLHSAFAHERQTDAQLAELNDYLMALQVLRHSTMEADSLFHRWQEVREASWKIRELTDEQDLSIDAPEVVEQIENTRKLRESLLRDCRAFFQEQTEVLPTAQIHLGQDITIDWADPTVSTPVGSRQVVLLELTSDRSEHTHLHVSGSSSDQILFWSKDVTVHGSAPRYTFAYVAPQTSGPTETAITVREDGQTSRTFTIRADGTLPATYTWYNHQPAETIFDIEHAATPRVGDAMDRRSPGGDESIQFRIRHPDTGDPMPVRVEVRDADGNAYWNPLGGPSYAVERDDVGWETPLWSFQPGPFFYIGGDARLGVDPAGKTAHIYHGFEFEPAVTDVPDDGVVEAAPQRWIDMAARGWYSGHTHIHTTDAGLPVQYNRFWPLVTRAEDLGLSAVLTLQGEREEHSIYADEYPMGPLASHSSAEHLITYGEEYRNNPYGHLALLGLDQMILPVSSGSLGELGGPDYPPNQFVLEEAVAQGGLTIGAHFGHFIAEGEPIESSWPSTGFEMPIDVALGNMHVAEIYGNGGQREIWYKLLNCGFDIPATAGPDWIMKDTPRAYVYLGDKPLTVDNWLEGLRRGRSFITRGPMLFFTVEGRLPGSTLHYSDHPQEVTVKASALTPDGSEPVEIIVNGEIVARGSDLSQTITIDDSAWIAARTGNAHSNPIYVTLEGRSRGFPEEAEEFIEITDRLEEWVHTKALFETEAQKQTVLNVLEQGRAVYENIADRARRLGRTSPR